MKLSPEQLKGRLKNVAKQNKADARTLMRIYMMERFLERVANSRYKDNFIIKGGMLVTSMVGIGLRSTMDIDTSVRNQNLSEEDAKKIIEEIADIDLEDGIDFEITGMSNIMDEMEYPGLRFYIKGNFGKIQNPIKIDISTGDMITPGAIEHQYKMLLENRSILLWSYNLETILAEKLQTILNRDILNTRMRDFYDIYILLLVHENEIKIDILKQAFEATCEKRGTENLSLEGYTILKRIKQNLNLKTQWKSYQNKYSYAADIQYEDVIKSTESLFKKIVTQ